MPTTMTSSSEKGTPTRYLQTRAILRTITRRSSLFSFWMVSICGCFFVWNNLTRGGRLILSTFVFPDNPVGVESWNGCTTNVTTTILRAGEDRGGADGRSEAARLFLPVGVLLRVALFRLFPNPDRGARGHPTEQFWNQRGLPVPEKDSRRCAVLRGGCQGIRKVRHGLSGPRSRTDKINKACANRMN
jgi:hypothetical protein